MSKQRLHAASQSCTGTVDAAMEEKREGINQWGPKTSSARMGSLQMAPVWAALQVTDAYRDAHLPLSPSFFQALSLLTTMPGGYFFPALPWLDLSPTPAHILPQTIVSFQADERRHSPTTLLPKSMLSGGANSSSSALEHAGCIASEPARSLAPKGPLVLGVRGPREREEGGDRERAGRQHIQQSHNSSMAKAGKLISDGPIKQHS